MKVRGTVTLDMEIDPWEAWRIMCKAWNMDEIFLDEDFSPDNYTTQDYSDDEDEENELYKYNPKTKKWELYDDRGELYEGFLAMYEAIGGG